MTADKQAKRAARRLAESEGISYTAARRRLHQQPPSPEPGTAPDDAVEAYAAAVAAAVVAAGGRVADWDVHIDEDSRIYLTLGSDEDDLDEDERRWVLAWIDTRSWFRFREPAHGEALGDLVQELPLSYVALPDQVAQAAAHLWGGVRAEVPLPGLEHPGTGWAPPAHYDPNPAGPDEPGDPAPELEAVLRVYLHHPAYRDHLARTRRVMAAGELGDQIGSDDVRNGLFDREGDWADGTIVLTDAENWNYARIEHLWRKHAAAQLAGHGIHWYIDTDRVTLPATSIMSHNTARRLWQQHAVDAFARWLDDIVDATRQGKPGSDDEQRPDGAPGGTWITEPINS